MRHRKFPLKVATSEAWGQSVLADPCSLLNDHAHLEKKAASNAFDLLLCWPGADAPRSWIETLCSVANDEIRHLSMVVRFLEKRGGKLSRAHRNHYAFELRKLVRKGSGPKEILDRLLISALIEVRSCERFEILARVSEDSELAKAYKALWASEHGHYKVFLELASLVRPQREVQKRWEELLEEEAKIIVQQATGATMHSWVNVPADGAQGHKIL